MSNALFFPRAFLALTTTVAMLLVPVAPGIAQPENAQGGRADGAPPPAEMPPGPPESARHPDPSDPPASTEADPRGKPAAPLGAANGPDASVRGLEEDRGLRGEGARFFEDEGYEPHVVQLYTDPISYRDGGEWKPIDSTVVPTDGGFTNAANSFDVFFPSTLTPARPIVLTYPEGALSFSLVRAAPSAAVPDGRTVTYPDVYPGTDLAIDVTTDGIKERAIVGSPNASAHLTYSIDTRDLDLQLEDDGSVSVTRSGEPFGTIPPAFAVDSSKDLDSGKPATTYDVAASLRPQGPGAYRLDYEVDDGWLDAPERVYPVTIDPRIVRTRCEDYYPDPCPEDKGIPQIKDTYIRQGVTTPQDQKPFLAVDKASGSQARTFMTFDFRQEVRKIGDLIYDTQFDILVDYSANPGPAELEMRRITDDWDARVTWDQFRPNVQSDKIWATDDGCTEAGSCKDGWNRWDVTDLMQYWIDTQVLSNHGWEISMASTSTNSWKEYVSGDAANPFKRPYVNVWVNAMPGTKGFAMDDADWPKLELAADALPNGTTLEIDSPKLEIKDLIDKNLDKILVRYQVSKNPAGSFAGGIEYDSGWIPETHAHRVPSGYLSDGTHYWRVMAGDVCVAKYKDPDEPELGNGEFICDDLGADNTRVVSTNERPTSEVRSFTITGTGKQIGKDPRWAMWSRRLGNGMQLSVNQSNGNAVFEYPVDTLGTAQAPVNVRLTHNTQQAMRVQAGKDQAVPGLPPGWEIAAGPAADPEQMPVRLKPLTYATPTGTTVTYAVAVTYESGKRDVFIDSGNGLFLQAGPLAATVRSTEADEWVLTTHSGGTYVFSAAGTLTKARPSSARPGTPGFAYEFLEGRLQHLVDPLGRTLTFNYQTPAGSTTTMLKEIVAFANESDPSKRLVWTMGYDAGRIASITDPEGATVKTTYDTSQRLSTIVDGVQATKTSPKPTTLEYNTGVFGTDRPVVAKVLLPAVETVAPEGSRNPSDPYGLQTTSSGWEFKYEPANPTSNYSRTTTVTAPRGRLTALSDDYQVITDFNDIGLPIEQRGPRIEGEFGGWPVTRKVWDFTTGNLVCHRGPAANAVSSAACGVSDGLQTQYEYQVRVPFLLTRVTESAAVANGPRLVTTYSYDEGFRGLQTHYYTNNALTGLPDAIDISPTVSATWGDGGPAQIDQDSDFSVRYFGEWVPPDSSQAKDYEFRVTAEDEARLIVGNEILVDCIATGVLRKCSGGTQNTATAKGVGPAAARIVVELRAVTGPAHVKLEWKRADGTFEVVPESALRPAIDAQTSEKVGTVTTPAAYSTSTYEYGSADQKLRRLASSVELSGGPETPKTVTQRVSYTYDEHGRIETEMDATDQSIVHEFEENGPCEHTTTDRAGLVTTRICNLAGDVVSQTVHIGGVTVNGSTDVEQRTTTTSYTALGRVDRIDFPDGGYVDNDYDLAGDLLKKTVLETGGGVTRVTDYVRNAQGWVTEEHLPDPDGTGSTPRPIVESRYDADGNRIVREDERDKKWIEEFDALNRRIERHDPVGNKWVWKYGFAGVLRKKVDPQGVTASFGYDALNRLESKALGSLPAATTTYDLRGSVETRTDPDGIQTSFDHDAAGNLVVETTPAGTLTRKYNGSGFLVEETSRRNHTTTYGYDHMGRLKTVTAPGPYTTEYVLNEAGEVEVTRLPGETIASGSWQFDYDKMGRVTREVDAAGGVRTATYNKVGEAIATTDGSDFRIDTIYDRMGRVDQKAASRIGVSGAPDTLVEIVDFAYDATGNLTGATNDEGTILAGYDAAGRLETVTADGRSTTFVYEGSRLKSRTDAAGTTSYTYEAATGRIQSISGPFDATHTTTFDYKPSGRIWHQTELRGQQPEPDLKTTFSYDNVGRPFEKKLTNPDGTTTYATFSSAYNGDSQVTSRTRTIDDGTHAHPDNGTWQYTYDARGLLDATTDPDGVFTEYDYDGAGNRKLVKETRTDAGITRITTTQTDYVGSRPQDSTKTITINGVAEVPLETTYQHDRAGNLLRIDGPLEWRSFTYDEWGQMDTANKGVPAEAAFTKYLYRYDALGRTVEKGTDTETNGVEVAVARELYWHEGLGDELVQSSLRGPSGLVDADTVVTSYGYRAGEPYAVEKKVPLQDPVGTTQVSLRWLGTDPHGDVVYSMDAAHELKGMQSYDPWGVLRADEGEKPHLGFQSDHTDADVGIVDMGARYYLPELGRFITQDPFGGIMTKPLSLNPYIYGTDDPVSNVDPDGACARPSICGPPPGQTPEQRARSVELAQQGAQVMAPPPILGPPTPPWMQLFRPYWGSTGESTIIHFSGVGFEAGMVIPHVSGISVKVTTADAQVVPIEDTHNYWVTAQLFYQSVNDSDVPLQPGGRGLAVDAKVCGVGREAVCVYLLPGQVSNVENAWRAGSYGEPTQEERSSSRAGVFHWHGVVPFEVLGIPQYAEFQWIGQSAPLPVGKNDVIWFPMHPSENRYYAGESPY